MRNKKWLSIPFFFFLAFIVASALAKGVLSFSLDKRISLCQAPSTPQRISGPNFNEVIYSEPFTVSAKDISSIRSCFPHDIVFSIWENVDGTYQKIRSSHWLDDRITFYRRTYSWPWEALPAGGYQWRVNLKNTNEQTLAQPLIVPFKVVLRYSTGVSWTSASSSAGCDSLGPEGRLLLETYCQGHFGVGITSHTRTFCMKELGGSGSCSWKVEEGCGCNRACTSCPTFGNDCNYSYCLPGWTGDLSPCQTLNYLY